MIPCPPSGHLARMHDKAKHISQGRGMTFARIARPVVISAVVSLALCSPAATASAQVIPARDVVLEGRSQVPAPTTENLARGALTGDRAVVVLEGGRSGGAGLPRISQRHIRVSNL